ncbi:MAG: hypothetical protein ACYS6W_17970, partial [Planctomycetota bacterium]
MAKSKLRKFRLVPGPKLQALIEKEKHTENIPVYAPQTLGEYCKLCEILADEAVALDKSLPELSAIYGIFQQAFLWATSLLQYNRLRSNRVQIVGNIGKKTKQPLGFRANDIWLYSACMLAEHMNRLSRFQHYWYPNASAFYEQFNWPTDPKSTAFDQAGRSAFEAAFKFMHELNGFFSYDVAADDLSYDGHHIFNETELAVEPRLDRKIVLWKRGVQEFIDNTWPPSRWTLDALECETASLRLQINYEYDRATGRQKARPEKPGDTEQQEPNDLVSLVDQIIDLVRHGDDLYETLRSDEVQDLTARLVVLGGRYKLLDSNSLVWLYWGDSDSMKLKLYCEPESEYFEDFGVSLCAELRIMREKAKLLSSETESAENQAARNGSTCANL